MPPGAVAGGVAHSEGGGRDMADDEFAAFQAELNQLEAPAKAAVGPRAPQVITAKPQGPTPVKAREPIPLPQPVMGGPRVPVAQWPKPEKLVAEIQQEYPKNPMQLSALHKESGGAPSGSSGAGAPGATLSAATAMSLGRLQPGQMPGDGTIMDNGSGSLAQVGEPRIPVKPVGGWPSQQQDKPPPPPPPPGGKPLGKLKADAPSIVKRTVAGKSWVDQSLLDWPEDDFRVFVGDLGNETNDDVLAHAFSKYPSFQKAKVIRNKHTQKSMGYGFASFKDPWDMTKALREMQGKYIGNRPVKVRKSTWKDRAEDGKDMSWMGSSLAVNIKDKGLGAHVKKKPPKKKKGMPW